MALTYPDALLQRLQEAWAPPHCRPRAGPPSGTVIPEPVIRDVLAQVFFSSLRSEEGEHFHKNVVLVPHPSVLSALHPPWVLLLFRAPFTFDAARLAKLSPTMIGDERFLVVQVEGVTTSLVGIGQPSLSSWSEPEDLYPRVRSVGPGDLVFYKGSAAVLRYRAGEADGMRPDFFLAGAQAETAMRGLAEKVFPHWSGGAHEATVAVVARFCTEMVSAISSLGRGGLLAVLAPGESIPDALVNACDYPLHAVDLGAALVNDYESGQVMARLEREIMGPAPDFLRTRALSSEEVDNEVEWASAQSRRRKLARAVAGMSAVDGALLCSAALVVAGFGCKLPGIEGEPPEVVRPSVDPRETPRPYDLSKKGTRHGAAARFASDVHGRMAFTISSDGPSGCFTWSQEHRAVGFWPVHVGAFSPSRG